MPQTQFFSPSVTDCNSLSVSEPPPPVPTPTIVAISCLLCMDFDCTQGVILHPAPSSHTNTQITYIHAQKGRKKYLPSEDLLIKCAVKSCQAFHVRAQFPARGSAKERTQTRVGYNVICTTFTTVYYSYSINSAL